MAALCARCVCPCRPRGRGFHVIVSNLANSTRLHSCWPCCRPFLVSALRRLLVPPRARQPLTERSLCRQASSLAAVRSTLVRLLVSASLRTLLSSRLAHVLAVKPMAFGQVARCPLQRATSCVAHLSMNTISTQMSLRPNPSFKPTRYGRQRKPGLRHLVHHLSPGLRCLPPRAA